MGFDESASVAGPRAQLKSGVALCCEGADGERKHAPRGDYILTRMSDETLGFRSLAGAGVFTLSIDAVAQHVLEGRMSLDGALPTKRR